MAMGFYDLWKNVPYFKHFVVRMFRPAAAVFEWLEGHTQVGHPHSLSALTLSMAFEVQRLTAPRVTVFAACVAQPSPVATPVFH